MDPGILKAELTDTGKKMEGSFWFFHHNRATAHNGVEFFIECRVLRYFGPKAKEWADNQAQHWIENCWPEREKVAYRFCREFKNDPKFNPVEFCKACEARIVMNTVLVRTASHRSRDNLERLLRVDRLKSYYTGEEGGVFVMIPTDRSADARKIKGITKATPKGEIHRCWKGGGF